MASTVNESETPIKRRDENKRVALMAAVTSLQNRRNVDVDYVLTVAKRFSDWLER